MVENARPKEEMTKEEQDEVAAAEATVHRIRVKKMMQHPVWFWFITLCVMTNTVTQATKHYEQPYMYSFIQGIFSKVFIGLFFVEMCLKLYALGVKPYFKSTFNAFDAVVVFLGILEMIMSYAANITLGLSVLRALKLLKLFKFTQYWESLKKLIGALMGCINSILSLMVLVALFLMIFALLGMTLFGGKFAKVSVLLPRANFDNFWNAYLTVFQILTGEDWNNVMYTAIRSKGGRAGGGAM